MNASIEKAIAPLITAGAAALIALLGGQAVDLAPVYAALLSTASGLITAGIVYLIPYSQSTSYKAIFAAVGPLVVAVGAALSTGEIDGAAILLLVQGVVGALATRYSPRTETSPGSTVVVEGRGFSSSS